MGIRCRKTGKQHHRSKTPEWRAWRDMLGRCQNSTHPSFKDYGGRGIRVCERWLDFSPFFEDMGLRPGRGYSLDRKENNGNYEPTNCRWATAKQQVRNRRTVRLSEDRVVIIKSLLKSGVRNGVIAKMFNAHPSTIAHIRRGDYWA